MSRLAQICDHLNLNRWWVSQPPWSDDARVWVETDQYPRRIALVPSRLLRAISIDYEDFKKVYDIVRQGSERYNNERPFISSRLPPWR